MKYPKILVTDATGRTGSAGVDEHLAKGVLVRALVHSKDARSAALERKGGRNFETTARRYAAQLEAQRNFANWLGAFADFVLTPVRAGYDPERLDRELRFPMPPAPRLAMANERWKVEHGAQFVQRPVMERPRVQRTLVRDGA